MNSNLGRFTGSYWAIECEELQIRRYTRIRQADLMRLRISLPKVNPFLKTADHSPLSHLLDSDQLRTLFVPEPLQLELFSADEMRRSGGKLRFMETRRAQVPRGEHSAILDLMGV